MKHGSVYQTEEMMILDEAAKRYLVIIRRGHFQIIVVFIELEQIYQLMENVALYRQFAFIDNLTGALTRHGYWNELFDTLKFADKAGDNIGIIFIDVDNLKKMNVVLGYKGGDLQIAEVANSVRKALRKNDLLVRIGGDEFLAILPMRTNRPELLKVITNRILENVRKNTLLQTTVSLGADFISNEKISKTLEQDDIKAEWEKYLEVVDYKLKEAKGTGKNQAIL